MKLVSAFMGNSAKTYNFDKEPMYDRHLLVIFFLLITLGLIVVYTSSVAVAGNISADEFFYVKRQCFFLVAGLFAGFLVLHIPTIKLSKYCSLLTLFAAVSLCIIAVIIGPEIKGAKRWIELGLFNFQPSEAIKIVWILFLAGFIESHKNVMSYTRQSIKISILLSIIVGILFLQKDFGSAVVISVITMGMLFIANCSKKFMAIAFGFGSMAIIGAILVAPYRIIRLTTYLNPWDDSSGNGYQLVLSLMSYGRGALFGQGLGNGVFKLSYIPDPHTDFVTSVWAEETGLIGMLILIALEFLLIIKAFTIAFECFRSQNNQNVLQGEIAIGFGMWFLLQVSINIGSASGLLPTKGLTLPFISYGGSSLLMMVVAVCILVRITYERRQFALDNLNASIRISKQLKRTSKVKNEQIE